MRWGRQETTSSHASFVQSSGIKHQSLLTKHTVRCHMYKTEFWGVRVKRYPERKQVKRGIIFPFQDGVGKSKARRQRIIARLAVKLNKSHEAACCLEQSGYRTSVKQKSQHALYSCRHCMTNLWTSTAALFAGIPELLFHPPSKSGTKNF